MPELLAILVVNVGFWGGLALGAVGAEGAGIAVALASVPLAVAIWLRATTRPERR